MCINVPLCYILQIRVKTALLVVVCLTLATVCVLKYFITIDSSAHLPDFPIIMWWTPFMAEMEKFINCENQFRCLLTKNRTYQNHSNLAAYMFYGSSFDHNDLPLPKGEVPWAIFHEESPKNLAFFLDIKGQKLFNITSTFSRNSDFPVPLQFLKDLHQITDLNYYVPLHLKNSLLSELAPVLYIQSDCDTPSQRDKYVSELMQYINVDSYGICLNNKQFPARYTLENVLEDLYEDSFMKFVAQYKFTIAIENSVCHDYITEKLWRPLIVGSVPIYLGSPSIQDWLPNDNSAILVRDFKSVPALAQYIHQVNIHDELYEKYMEHKLAAGNEKVTNKFLKSVLRKGDYGIENNKEFPVPAFECFVCRLVHENAYKIRSKSAYECDEPSTGYDTENWWKVHWKMGRCQAKTLEYFLEIRGLSNFTKEMFDAQCYKYLTDDEC